MPEMPNLSARFLHFSVFGNLKRDHYWSFCKRVIVSYDKESSTFHCKCCPARRSCIHKCIVKWSIAQSQPSLLGTSVNLSANDDEIGEEQTNTIALSDSEQGEVDDENPESVANVDRAYYPPTGEVATKMVRYLFDVKKIPSKLPLNLTVQKENFKKRYAGKTFVNDKFIYIYMYKESF